MKIFLDTANLIHIQKALEWGVLDGVTTNPTLLSKEGKDPLTQLKKICELVKGPVSAEVVSSDCQGMIKEAQELSKIASNIVIKIPLTFEGLKAVRTLKEKGIKTNVTLCFSPSQALLVAKAGADFISPFIGRLDDISSYGMRLVSDIKLIYENYGFKTQIIVASVRHPMHVLEAAKIGAHISTLPFGVLEKLIAHPLTNIGIQRFLDDWKRLQENLNK